MAEDVIKKDTVVAVNDEWDGCGCKDCKELGDMMRPIEAPMREVATKLHEEGYDLVGSVVDQVIGAFTMMSSVHLQDTMLAADSFFSIRECITNRISAHQMENIVKHAVAETLQKMIMPVGSVNVEDGLPVPPGFPGFKFPGSGPGSGEDGGGGFTH